jgi:hypothetical protein
VFEKPVVGVAEAVALASSTLLLLFCLNILFVFVLEKRICFYSFFIQNLKLRST